MKFKAILLLSAICAGIASCSQDEKKAPVSAPVSVQKPTIGEPFKYHKMIEVAPGQYYDVLSWGRGTRGGGAYMILRSDSTEQKYDTTTGDLEGPIQDVLNTDMDIDGNPEIIIQAKSIDTSRFTNVFVYEYNGNRSQKIDFPRMTVSQRKGFRGEDRFYVKDSKLMREFPIFEGSGNTAKPTGEKRLLEYSLHSNSLSAKTVSADTTATGKTTDDKKTIKEPVAAPPVKTETQTKKAATTSSSSSKKRHHTVEKRSTHKTETKKKKRRHRN